MFRSHDAAALREARVEHLFSRGRIGALELPNRLLMSAMGPKLANIHGEVTDSQVAYYAARAAGGPGMIVVEAAVVTDERNVGNLGIHSDLLIPGLSKVASCINERGVRSALQLTHFGGTRVGLGRQFHVGNAGPDDLDEKRIGELVDRYVEAARRAKIAGFDAVQMHAAHGHLVFQFLSPLTNHRTDKFGGSPERRAEFLRRIIMGTKSELGQRFPLLIKISAHEYMDGGFTLDDCRALLPLLEDAGLDAIEVSAGNQRDTKFWNVQPMAFVRGCLVDLAASLKEIARIPVITVGRINDVVLASEIIRDGKADFVAMGRALLADPDLPNKAAAGRVDDILPCIACNWCHGKRTWAYKPIGCAVNPLAGREYDLRVTPADDAKQVLVAGGGVAGMEAAILLAQRGHRVSLYEAEDALGGQSSTLAVAPPHKDEIRGLVEYMVRQIAKLPIDVHLDQPVTVELIKHLNPAAVVIAAGVRERVPPLPGIEAPHVTTAHRVLMDGANLGGTVVVAGAGQTGSETAEYLAERGHEVALVGRQDEIAHDLEPLTRRVLVSRLERLGVSIRTGSEAIAIGEDSVTIKNGTVGTEEVPAESVVIAMGVEPDTRLFSEVEAMGMPAYLIGDSVRPGDIADAIHSAFHTALAI